MRLVAGVLALTLFASFARADDTRPPEPTEPAGSAGSAGAAGPAGPAGPAGSTADVTYRKVPLRVVRVMAQSHQALLFDRSRATHVLAEVGGKIGGYTVEAIDDDEVTLSFEGKQIVLAAPPRGGNRRHDRDMPAMHASSAAGARQTDPVAGEPTPIDPYGAPPVRVTEAPGASGVVEPGHASRVIEAGQGGIRVAEAPGGTASPSHNPAEMPAPHPVALDARPANAGPVDARPAGIRVAEAPPNAAPNAPSSPSAAPSAPSFSPRAPSAPTTQPRDAQAANAPTGQGGIRIAEAPAGMPSVPPAIEARPVPSDSPAIEARPVSSVPPAVEARPVPSVPPAIEPRPIATRPPEVPAIKAPDVRTADAARGPDKQTLDARAMADVMSAGSRSRGTRTPASGPASGPFRTATPPAADPRPAIPAPPASDIRTASAAPGGTVVLSRSEVDGALADFARLAAAVRGSFSASGLAVDAVAEGSIFARAGLRAGDVVTAVDGAPLRSLDAAANLYARASSTKALTAQIVRSGSPMTLHVAIQ